MYIEKNEESCVQPINKIDLAWMFLTPPCLAVLLNRNNRMHSPPQGILILSKLT